jgi:hypothetical protein
VSIAAPRGTVPPHTEAQGVAAVQGLFASWGWLVREQFKDDYGIDAHVEPVYVKDRPSGRLLGLQIKAGPSYFDKKKETSAGWWYWGEKTRHLDYWLDHSLPVLIVMYDPASETLYWEHVTGDRAIRTGVGWKILIPRDQVLSAAAPSALPSLRAIADGAPRASKDPVAATLAALVASECERQLSDRVDRGRPPLRVKWRPGDPPGDSAETALMPPAGDTGDPDPLVARVQRGLRLVVTGPWGAGKTTLALRLTWKLAASWSVREPVPVLLSATSLAEDMSLAELIERSLADRYPSLRAYGKNAIRDLVAERGVLPVVDDLNLLDRHGRARLLEGLERSFGRERPLIIACRPDEYREATADRGIALAGAVVIELQPVLAEDAAAFIEHDAIGPASAGWARVAATLRAEPAGPLARLLDRPLRADLARYSYADDPAGLVAGAESDDQAGMEATIVRDFVSAMFTARASSEYDRPKHPWKPGDAARWHNFLARLLVRLDSHDLGWRQLRQALPVFRTPLRMAAFAGLLAWVLAGTAFGLSEALAANWHRAVVTGVLQGLDPALLVGALYLLLPLAYPKDVVMPGWLAALRRRTATPFRLAVAASAGYAVESGIRDGLEAARHGTAVALSHGLIPFALNWLISMVIIYLGARFSLVALVERPVYFSLRGAGREAALVKVVAAGLFGGGIVGLGVGYGVKFLSGTLSHSHPLWLLGVPSGAVIGVVFALIKWSRTPAETAPATTPQSVLRADLGLVLLFSCTFLVVLPLFWGVAFAPHLLPRHLVMHALYGLGIGITLWLAVGLSHAWPQYILTATWLAARGKLPWRLAAFLRESASPQVGVLCPQGINYQYRYPTLRDRLASQ